MLAFSPAALQAHLHHNRAARSLHMSCQVPDDISTMSMPLMTATLVEGGLQSRPTGLSDSFESSADTASLAM